MGTLVQYEFDSACSTPYVSAPSSPGRPGSGFFFSAPTSPMHMLRTRASAGSSSACRLEHNLSFNMEMEEDDDFEFSARFLQIDGGDFLSSADELFCNGKIKPMKLSSHLEKPQAELDSVSTVLPDAIKEDDEEEEDEGNDRRVNVRERDRERLFRDKSCRHRRTRSLSPLRSAPQWRHHEEETEQPKEEVIEKAKVDSATTEKINIASSSTSSTSSSCASTSGRRKGSKRWSIKDLFLYRSKSEGHQRERGVWALSFSTDKDKNSSKNTNKFSGSAKKMSQDQSSKPKMQGRRASNGSGQRKNAPSAHELHYTANRAHAEELRRKTFLPYRQGVLGCLGFPSKTISNANVFARSLKDHSQTHSGL